MIPAVDFAAVLRFLSTRQLEEIHQCLIAIETPEYHTRQFIQQAIGALEQERKRR